jgi:uncharacterized protein
VSAAPPLLPVREGERLANLDVVRAVALFGVLIVNLLTELRVSIFAQFFGPAEGTGGDRAIDRFVAIAIEFKAFALFSLLFGIGLAIQLERARAGGRSFGVHLARRMGSLFVIGLAHLVLIWNGDILTEYALAGLLIAPLVGRPPRVLLVAAAILLALFVAPLPYPDPFVSMDALRAHVAEANGVYAAGGYRDVLAFRLHEIPPILALDLGALPRVLALFALGGWVWRTGVFQRPEEHRRLLSLTVAIGIPLGGAANLFMSGALASAPPELGAWGTMIDDLGGIALALGYGAGLVLLFERPGARRVLQPLAPLGRMALTNYLGQSVIFGFVFYGYGLGQFGKMSVTHAALLGVAVYVAQAVASAWWLRRFRFGPVEWIWRGATYGRLPRLRGDTP